MFDDKNFKILTLSLVEKKNLLEKSGVSALLCTGRVSEKFCCDVALSRGIVRATKPAQ